MKSGNGFNRNIERTLPPSLAVQVGTSDVTGLRFAVIRSVNQADVVVSVSVSEPEHLRTLKLNLYREDQPGQAVHTIRLEQSPLAVLPVLPMDGRRYYLQLESNLGRHQFDYQTPEVTFTANRSAQHISLQFNARRRAVETAEATQVSVRGMLFLLLCGAAAYYYQSLAPLVSQLMAVATNALKPARGGFSFGPAADPSSSSNPNTAQFSEQELALMEPTIKEKKKVKPRRAQ